MWIHGLTDRGIIGPIGGLVTCQQVRHIATTAWPAGTSTTAPARTTATAQPASPDALWTSTTPPLSGTDATRNTLRTRDPAISCYSQSTGGYGDGVGTPPGHVPDGNVDHSTFRYNTQDGLDLGHIDTGSCSMSITNSKSIGNNGATSNGGPTKTPSSSPTTSPSPTVSECRYPSGSASTYNANLSDFCRACDACPSTSGKTATALRQQHHRRIRSQPPSTSAAGTTSCCHQHPHLRKQHHHRI